MGDRFVFVFIILFLLLISCQKKQLSEEEYNKLLVQCAQSDSVNDLRVVFAGYEYEDIENVLVKQVHDGLIIDSFYVSTNRNTYDSIRIQYSTYIDRNIYVGDSYIFTIPKERSYVVSNLQKSLKEHRLMNGYRYDCWFDGCTIDGEESEDIYLEKNNL